MKYLASRDQTLCYFGDGRMQTKRSRLSIVGSILYLYTALGVKIIKLLGVHPPNTQLSVESVQSRV